MSLVDAVFTRTDYMKLPEGFPAQLVEGFLVREPAPTFEHQTLKGRIFVALHALVGDRRVAPAPLDVVLDELNVFQPDIVCFAEVLPLDTERVPVPMLAVEVLWSSTRMRDRGVKTRRLLAAGVREVWLVDPRTATIDVCTTAGARTFREGEEARSEVVHGFTLTPSALFAS